MSNVMQVAGIAGVAAGASSLAAVALRSPIGAVGGALFGGFTVIAFAGVATLAVSTIPEEQELKRVALMVAGTAFAAWGLMAAMVGVSMAFKNVVLLALGTVGVVGGAIGICWIAFKLVEIGKRAFSSGSQQFATQPNEPKSSQLPATPSNEPESSNAKADAIIAQLKQEYGEEDDY